MALPVWQSTIVDNAGDIQPGAEVTVVDEATGVAPAGGIWSDRAGSSALTNPFFADSNGFAQFYANPGNYRITAAGAGGTVVWRYVVLEGTAATADTGTAAGQVPLNSDLGTAATADTGTAAGNVPLNSDLGTAATKNTGTAAGEVPLAEDVILETEKVSSSTDTTAGKVLLVGAGHQQLDATLWRSGNLDQETAGGIGTLRLMENNSGGTILNGATIAGSSLRYAYASVGGVVTPLGSATGTWKNVVNNVNDTTGGVFTYFVRIA
jgi:hypothetical protein